ncbi:hypothetical protein [Nocardioides plantarum]|uniref:Uncharacterized protein n=1 Tax=Nocardioides plantarum TaxID=29299 RepID=A0ABV5KG93_9ACTN|nr:hypothetical protein [Nocardioides plantarum]
MHPRFYSLPGYDDDRRSSTYDDPHSSSLPERLTHLVLVDGRLVDLWHEPVEDTRWSHHAERFDRERRPAPPPEPPHHEQVLTWLAAVCGGRTALDALDAEPLTGIVALPVADDATARDHLAEAAALLDRAAATYFDPETAVALRRALAAFWEADPHVRLKSAARVAGGVCWAVGRANGLLGPHGRVTQGDLSRHLGLGSSGISSPGQTVRRSLEVYAGHAPRPWPWPWPGSFDVELRGRPDLLLASTRRRLVTLRDQARAMIPETVLP